MQRMGRRRGERSANGLMIERREVLKWAAGGLAAGLRATMPAGLSLPALAGETPPTPLPEPMAPEPPRGFPLGEPHAFDPADVAAKARNLAKQPYRPLPADCPDVFRNLGYEQYASIRQKPGTAIWANENVGFALEPLHRGFIFANPVEILLVNQGEARRIGYDPALYDFGAITPPGNLGDIGFSGFRVLDRDGAGRLRELAIFQGASFFRAVARGQTPGIMARALSIKTGDPRGEEFPAIRTIWIERPLLASHALILHALIDSESVTGAYRFTIRPGEATLIDTECTLFARQSVDNFGLATMSATHLFGDIDRRRADDLRPNVNEVSGLQMLTGQSEWIWRPVSNRDTLQISTFVDENPRGFGFLQRERDFKHYQDDDQRWETRPSLWIEPIGEWGKGVVQLLEIPSESEVNDNIMAFWKPRQPLVPGSEATFAYRQFWCWYPPERPALATATLSRHGRGPTARQRRFIVEFTGETIASRNADEIKPNLTATPGSISSVRTFVSTERKSCRVLFDLDTGGESFSELRLVIEAAGAPISETWLYRWTP
jgi:glucans biosynthesis protein